MCRLLAFVATDKAAIPDIVGKDFHEFVSLSHVHRDGWGVSAVDRSGKCVAFARAPEIAALSPKFNTALLECVADGALLHLRRATGSLAVVECNAHPFVHDTFTFMHNGCISPTTGLDAFIAPDLLACLQGTTDSERYFMLALTEIRKSGLVCGLRSAVDIIGTYTTYSSINAMLLTPDTLAVISKHYTKARPHYGDEDYYHLRLRRDAGGVVVASSGWCQEGWDPVPNNTLVLINRATVEIEYLPI